MDGVLVDSMIYYVRADGQFLKTYDIELTKEMMERFPGRSMVENLLWLKEKYKLSESLENLIKKRKEYIADIYTKNTLPMLGARTLTTAIKSAGYKQAIASGAPRFCIDEMVKRFDWQTDFDELVSSDDTCFVGKPDPAIYIYTAKKLGVKPEDCLVFEDAQNGVESAKNAGMSCAAIVGQPWTVGDFSVADWQINSFLDPLVKEILF